MENPDDEKLQSPPSPRSGDLPDGLVLVSSGSEAQDAEDEDHEEGEIQDEDNEHQHELEDISSEEESTIRERMAALEAMDKKVGMMKKKIASHSIYGYLDEEDVMNGKENYCYYYPQHQQSSYRSQTTYKTSATVREDNRHSTSNKHKRASGTKRHVEKPTKEKPPKRSSHRHRKRRKYASRSPSPVERRPVSTDSEPEAVVDREYLKIACGIGNRKSGRLPSGRNPLRKKLLLQAEQKRKSAEKGKREPVAVVLLHSSSSENDMELEDEDDEEEKEEEEEELKLRLLALSTKPIVREAGLSDIISELQIPSPPPPPTIQLANATEDQSVEELRLIALKTAILNKHATRRKRRELDNEQPYSPSDILELSPVREMPPPYDIGDVYSDGRDSVELLDDDTDDVQIVEPQYEQINLIDSDDNENDMEISPLGSPIGGQTDRTEQDMEEDSQQPIDMELASDTSTSGRPSPVGDQGGEVDKKLLLHAGTDSCDSALFHRRGDLVPESPPVTPDSLEETEAEALRHLLLTKMRQKQSKKQVVAIEPPVQEEIFVQSDVNTIREDAIDTAPKEASPEVSPKPVLEEEKKEEELAHSALKSQHVTRPNLITLVDQKPARKRRKKSLSIANATEVVVPVPLVSSPTQPELPPELPKAIFFVQTQKLVNNPNKLINLNRTSAPSPPMLPVVSRTESPKELATVDTFVSRPVPKLVIQLGNSDSDSEVDFGEETPEKCAPVDDQADGGGSVTPIPTARFEEQLDKFLKSVRSKSTTTGSNEPGLEEQEQSDQVGESTGEKSLNFIRQQTKQTAKKQQPSSTMATPTAVKHLSKSAQLEYMKLVARMAQLERDKLARQNQATLHTSRNDVTRDTSVPNVAESQPVSSISIAEPRPEPKSGKSPGRRKQSFSSSSSTALPTVAEMQEPIQDPIERRLQQIRSSLPNLTEASRNRLLLTAEKHLEKHSDLEQHNASIIEAQQARRELYHLENRIDLLREKLALLEKVHDRQRNRTRDTFTSLHTTRKKILSSRKRSGELERMCIQIGRDVKGESYQLPTSTNGAEVQQQMRILTAEMHQLKSIRKPTLAEFKEEMIANHKRRLATVNEMPYENETNEEQRVPVEVLQPPAGETVKDTEEKSSSEIGEPKEEPCEPDPPTVLEECPEEVDTVKESTDHVEQPDIQSKEASNDAVCLSPVEPIVSELTAPEADNEPVVPEQTATEQEEPQHDVQMEERETIIPIVPDSNRVEEQMVESEDVLVPEEAYRIEKYTSPLMSLKQGAQNIPTGGILCPYELGGQCVDRDCKYEHFNQRAA
uniref:Zf-C3H1 domain-containing protein n=1 Tax=Anopheles christyi TaxID=43041 RepID=A0A182KDN9_9DIPT